MNKNIRSGIIEIRAKDEAARTITGMITTNHIDRYNEVVEPSGAILEPYRKNPVVLLNHNHSSLIGRNQWIKPEKDGLLAQTEFAQTQLGDEVMQLYMDGFMSAWSIGFIPKKWEDSSGDIRRTHTSWELLEYSAVTVPANPEALSNALTIVRSYELREALEHERDLLELRAEIAEVKQLTEDMREAKEKLSNMINRIEKLELTGVVINSMIEPEPIQQKRNPMLEKLVVREIARNAVMETLGDYGLGGNQ